MREAHIAAWRKSGLTKTGYARKHGIAPKKFYSWCYAQMQKISQPTNAFTQVQLMAPLHTEHTSYATITYANKTTIEFHVAVPVHVIIKLACK